MVLLFQADRIRFLQKGYVQEQSYQWTKVCFNILRKRENKGAKNYQTDDPFNETAKSPTTSQPMLS